MLWVLVMFFALDVERGNMTNATVRRPLSFLRRRSFSSSPSR